MSRLLVILLATGTVTISAKLGNWPFLVPVPQLAPLEGDDGEPLGVKASDCGECHDEVYAAWKQTTHATALQDLQFLAELAKPDSPRWLCLNCHIPVQNQRSILITPASRIEDRGHDLRHIQRVPNPGFDAAMQKESITCATCHVRPGARGKSVVIVPEASGDADHPVRIDAGHLRGMCLRCHSPGRARLTPTFFCWFETADELQAGPYAGKRDCVDCHMPKRGHHWVGGGVPKWYHAYPALIARGWKPGLEVDPAVVVPVPAGEKLFVRVRYANARAGHWLPTADPERFLLLTASVVDAAGKELARERLRIGQRWDWGDARTGRPAKRASDNRLKPGEVRTWELTLPRPAGETGARLVISALHVRLTVGNLRHMRDSKVSDFKQFLPDVATKIRAMEKHYPLFSWVHREEIVLRGGARTRATPEELVALSLKSRDLPLQTLDGMLAEE